MWLTACRPLWNYLSSSDLHHIREGEQVRLLNPALLVSHMEAQDFTQSRLAKHAKCTRQFIHMLTAGKRTTCSDELAERIELALRVLPGTIFVSELSPTMEQVSA